MVIHAIKLKLIINCFILLKRIKNEDFKMLSISLDINGITNAVNRMWWLFWQWRS